MVFFLTILFFSLFVTLSFFLSFSTSSACVSVSLGLSVPVCPSVCFSLSALLYVCQSVSFSLPRTVCLCLFPSLSFSSFYLFIQSFHSFIYSFVQLFFHSVPFSLYNFPLSRALSTFSRRSSSARLSLSSTKRVQGAVIARCVPPAAVTLSPYTDTHLLKSIQSHPSSTPLHSPSFPPLNHFSPFFFPITFILLFLHHFPTLLLPSSLPFSIFPLFIPSQCPLYPLVFFSPFSRFLILFYFSLIRWPFPVLCPFHIHLFLISSFSFFPFSSSQASLMHSAIPVFLLLVLLSSIFLLPSCI